MPDQIPIQGKPAATNRLPDLPSRLLEETVATLTAQQDRMVLGPATDGGYYLIGMNRPHPALFEGIEWSSDRVLARTLEIAKAQNLTVVVLEEWTDIDDGDDLVRLMEGTDNAAAARTRAWCYENLARGDA